MPKKISKKAVKKVEAKASSTKKASSKVAKKQADVKTTKKSVEKQAFQPHQSVIVKNDPVRWNRIEDEIIVDAHDEEERAMGWFYAIADHVDEHDLRCRCRKKRSMSPLEVGEEVDVLEIAPGDDCLNEIFVVVSWNERKLAVPLEQLEPIGGDPKTIEVVEDWLYWCLMGYEF